MVWGLGLGLWFRVRVEGFMGFLEGRYDGLARVDSGCGIGFRVHCRGSGVYAERDRCICIQSLHVYIGTYCIWTQMEKRCHVSICIDMSVHPDMYKRVYLHPYTCR